MAKKYIFDETLPFSSEATAEKKPGDMQQAYDTWKAKPTPQSRGALLQAASPVLDSALYTYAGASAGPNVRSHAKLLASKAFETYDPRAGNLKNHLMGQLRGITRYTGQQNQIIAVPERVALDRRDLASAEKELQDNLGRDPSDAEIADFTGLSLKRIGHIRQNNGVRASGSFLDDEGEVYSPASTIPGDASHDRAIQQMVYYDLTDIDRVIMDYTMGQHGCPRLETSQIAKRLGISPGAVSQRKSKIQSMLDEGQQLNLLGGG